MGDFYFCFIDLYLLLLKSLIIHQVKTKKITTVEKVWRFYFSLYSSVFASIEKIYQTLDTVFHQISKHLEFRQNTLRCASYFQLSSRCLDILMKQCLSCLIPYFKLGWRRDGPMVFAVDSGSSGLSWSPDRSHCAVLCSLENHFALTVPPFTQVYKWISIPTRG